MKKNIILLTVFLIIFTLSTFISIVNAGGFIDDWFTQKTITTGGYFESQKRGFFSGGSMSVRWPVNSSSFLSVTPPKINFGCGGIDAYLGGFSFMNFDYLVQKLQRIMTAAPAAAFDLALNQLCDPCSKTIKSLEAITNTLNSLQLSDCQAGKAIAAYSLDQLPWTDPKIHAEADKAKQLFNGITDLPQKITDVWKSDDFKAKNKLGDAVKDCPNELKEILTNNSLLASILQKTGKPNYLLPLLRGVFGDRLFDETQGWQTVPACPQNERQNITISDLINGNIYQNPGTKETDCVQISDNKKNLVNWAMNILTSINDKMKNKTQSLTNEEIDFIENIPAPIYRAIKISHSTKTFELNKLILADLTAKAYASKVFSDLALEMKLAVKRQKLLISANVRQYGPGCDTQVLTQGLSNYFESNEKTAMDYSNKLRTEYINALNEYNQYFNVSKKYDELEDKIKKSIANIFNPAIANRVLK